MDYRQTLTTLYDMLPDFQSAGAGAYKPGLERVVEFCRSLGDPHKLFCSVHVAGTNGKGSVSHMLASVLQSAGYRVGLYTSPHMRDFRERIRVDGEMIPESEVVGFTELHLEEMRSLRMSFFEATMCMAFDYFVRCGVEVAVVETGLGGRLDSTNILHPLLSVITNIGMDHQKFLGDTIEEIAGEKAGIIKRGVPVVVGESDGRTSAIFDTRAAEVGAEIVYADRDMACLGAEKKERSQIFTIKKASGGEEFTVATDLMGGYQCRNIVTAITTLSLLNKKSPLTISRRAMCEGLATAGAATGLRGRWEVLGRDPLVVCDTGHNPHGIALVARQIKGERYDKLYMVIGVMGDKDYCRILELLPAEAYYIFTQPAIARSLPAGELECAAARFGLRGEVVPGVADALARARAMATPRDMIFVGGSTFTVAEIIEA